MSNKTYKIKRTKAHQLVLALEVSFTEYVELMDTLGAYMSVVDISLNAKGVIEGLFKQGRCQSLALGLNYNRIYGRSEPYDNLNFIYWGDVKDCLLLKEDLEVNSTTPSVFKIRKSTKCKSSLGINDTCLVPLDSNEVKVVKDALSWGLLQEGYNKDLKTKLHLVDLVNDLSGGLVEDSLKERLNPKLYLMDLINDLVEVYQALEGISINDIFEVDLSYVCKHGLDLYTSVDFIEDLIRRGELEGLNRGEVALHIERTQEDMLEVEGFKLVGFYCY